MHYVRLSRFCQAKGGQVKNDGQDYRSSSHIAHFKSMATTYLTICGTNSQEDLDQRRSEIRCHLIHTFTRFAVTGSIKRQSLKRFDFRRKLRSCENHRCSFILYRCLPSRENISCPCIGSDYGLIEHAGYSTLKNGIKIIALKFKASTCTCT
jgi:hypothetical protein